MNRIRAHVVGIIKKLATGATQALVVKNIVAMAVATAKSSSSRAQRSRSPRNSACGWTPSPGRT